jgi:hypothetical protein
MFSIPRVHVSLTLSPKKVNNFWTDEIIVLDLQNKFNALKLD